MRVAHFVQRYPPALGGSEAYFARLSRYFAAGGYAVSVFTTNAVDLEAFWSYRGRRLKPGIRVEDGVEVRRYGVWNCPGQRQILRVLSQFPHRPWQRLTLSCNPLAWKMWYDAVHADLVFDLVHASAFPYGWPLACGLRLARRLNVPFLLTPFLHLGDPNQPHDRTRRAYTSPALMTFIEAADRVFAQTDVERDALLGRGVPPEKLVLLGMGVEPSECTGGDREAARQAWGVGPNEVVVGHLANNSVEKGSVDLLRAAGRCWQRGERFRLVLAGPEMPNFRTFWQHYGSGQHVDRLGVLTDQQKRDFFAGIDIFALPSRSDSFGLVFLEAWANGVPNIGYRAGGVAGVLRHEVDGLLVRCGDVSDLAVAIQRLVTSQTLRQRYGEAGRARLARDYCWKDKLELVRQIYQAAIVGHKHPSAPMPRRGQT